ncbi:MAG: hypothetical protein ACXVRQ_06470 [Gaiellaceae bacterium]
MVSWREVALGGLIALLATTAAGCGSSAASSSGTTTTTTGTTTNGTPGNGAGAQALAAFRSCLASHGVQLGAGFGGRLNGQGGNGQPPTGQPPQGQPPQGQGRPALTAKQQKAFTACRSKLPAGAQGGFGQRRPSNPAFAKYTQCLRQHGVTFGATNDPAKFRKASAACAKYAPNPSAGSGSGS